jgi:hypothetical protein
MDENKTDKTPAKMKWSTVATFANFVEARSKADAVKGKVKARPDGTFDVRVGTETKAAKAEQAQEQAS